MTKEIECDCCGIMMSKEQLDWEESNMNDSCYCDIWRQIKRLKNKIKRLKEEILQKK